MLADNDYGGMFVYYPETDEEPISDIPFLGIWVSDKDEVDAAIMTYTGDKPSDIRYYDANWSLHDMNVFIKKLESISVNGEKILNAFVEEKDNIRRPDFRNKIDNAR